MAPRTDLNENFERGGGDLAPPDNAGGGGNENQFSVWRSEDYEYSLDSSLCSISLSHAPLCTLARSPW